MKKRILSIASAALMLASATFATACEFGPHTHNFGEWTTLTEATCGDDGNKAQYCSCGEANYDSIPATEQHTYGAWEVTSTAYCNVSGRHKRTCSTCGDVDDEEIPMTNAHAYTEWEIVTDATCVSEGLKKRKCTSCSQDFTEVIPTTGVHKMSYRWDAENHWMQCRFCDEKQGEPEAHEPGTYCDVCEGRAPSTGVGYTLSEDGTYYIATSIASPLADTHIVIRPEYEGKPVRKLGDRLFNDTDVTQVTIPNTVFEFGYYMYEYAWNLKTVNFIGTADEFVQIKGVSVGADNFYINNVMAENIVFNEARRIPGGVFAAVKTIKTVTLGDSVTAIGNDAFRYCTALKKVVMSNSVKEISNQAFKGCAALNDVTFSTGLTKVDRTAFDEAAIRKYEDRIAYAGPWVVGADDQLTSIVIKEGTVGIAEYAFSGHDYVTSVVIPGSVKVVGTQAFQYCEQLASVTMGEGVEVLRSMAFGYTALTTLDIPASVTYVGGWLVCDTDMEYVLFKGVPTTTESNVLHMSNAKAVYFAGTEAQRLATRLYGVHDVTVFYYYSEAQPTTEGNYYHYDANGAPVKW